MDIRNEQTMTCLRFEELIFPYLDGKLSASEAACFLAHAGQCPTCEAALTEARAFESGLTAAFTAVAPPADFVANVMAALPQAQPRSTVVELEAHRSAKRFPFKVVFGGLGTVAAAAVLAFSINLGGVDIQPGLTPGVGVAEGPNVSIPIPSTDPDASGLPSTPGDETQPTDTSSTPSVQVADTQSDDGATSTAPAATTPEVTIPAAVDPTNDQPTVDQISLPKAAYGVTTEGTLSKRLVSSFDYGDIYTPSISDNNQYVTYYSTNNDQVYLWRSGLTTPDEPQYIETASTSAITLTGATATYDVNNPIFSPDQSMLAINARGVDSGVWISEISNGQNPWQLCGEGGGKLLAWSPNSAKLLFTDDKGSLFVGYPSEKRIFTIYEGNVMDVAWGSDSRTIVFTVEENGKINLYTAQIP